jgi:ubiquinone/menaquinone biosynthesis C-methylase UbiE
VAQELAGNLLGREVQPKVPDAGELAAIARRERRRLPTPGIDLRRFWADYLVGRRGELGIELLAETDDYRDLMGAQIKALSMRPGDVVLDLGSGVGEFPLRSFDEVGSSVRILMIDHVLAGLRRAQSRISERDGLLRSRVDALVADLDGVTACKPIPLAENSVDAVLGSLVLGYLRNPVEVLRDVRRILRAGGRIVVSSMVKDADISRVYVRHLDASQSELLTVRKGELGRLRQIRQDFLNDAAKIIDLEEFGVFKFFGAGELESMLRAAGFHDLRTSYAFGNPAQAVIVSARL